MGGKIAFEIAQQLVAQGQGIGLLFFIDTPRSDGLRMLERVIRRIHRRVYLVKRMFLLLNELRGKTPRDSIRRIREALEKNRYLRTTEVRDVNHSASREYRPSIYPGRITAVVSEQQVIYSRDDRLEWDDLAADGVEIYHMPGRVDDTILEPNVAILGKHLTASLEKSRRLRNAVSPQR